MEVAMLVGLAALGYALSTQPVANMEAPERKKDPKETFVNPETIDVATDNVTIVQSQSGHNNMVPFFGARVTQSMYSGATDGTLDLYTGKGKDTFYHKEEAPAFFAPESGTGNPWKAQVETDFEQSRQVTSLATKNVFPIEKVYVGPGVNDGYTNLPSGGYQQDAAREYAMPKTTDELRVIGQEKVTYSSEPTPGAHFITDMGIQAPVKKNRPDRFSVLTGKDGSLDRVNTAVGQQKGNAIYPEEIMKLQNRESTSAEFIGGPQLANTYLSYIRSFTEPFQEFMKLTVEGRPPPAGPVGGAALQGGPQSYNVQTHRDENMLQNVRGFETPMLSLGGQAPQAAQQGSQRYTEPLKQDVYARDVEMPGLLDAFKSNPYTKSLQSVA